MHKTVINRGKGPVAQLGERIVRNDEVVGSIPIRSTIFLLVVKHFSHGKLYIMNIILFGPPGAGKGTQARYLTDNYGMCHISTGDMFRKAITAGSALGLEAKRFLDAGNLVPDNLTIDMLRERVSGLEGMAGFILDGFPRTTAQAEALDEMLITLGRRIDAVVELTVDEDVVIERIAGRFSCAACGESYHDKFHPTAVAGICDKCGKTEFLRRSDDNADSMRVRLNAFHKQTAPVLPYYAARGLLHRVDGMGQPEDVFQTLKNTLGL